MVPTPRGEAYQVVRLWFVQQSESGKAWQFLFAATLEKADKIQVNGREFVWLPVSMVWRVRKHEKPKNEDYPAWDMTIPKMLVDQKGIGAYVIGENKAAKQQADAVAT